MLLIIFVLVYVRLLFSLLFLIVNSLNMSSLNMVIRSNVNVKRSGPGRDFTSSLQWSRTAAEHEPLDRRMADWMGTLMFYGRGYGVGFGVCASFFPSLCQLSAGESVAIYSG